MKLLVLIALSLSGCANQVTSIKHLSDPRVNDDGYDLICHGVEVPNRIEISAEVCKNVARNSGTFAMVEIRYHWERR